MIGLWTCDHLALVQPRAQHAALGMLVEMDSSGVLLRQAPCKNMLTILEDKFGVSDKRVNSLESYTLQDRHGGGVEAVIGAMVKEKVLGELVGRVRQVQQSMSTRTS